MAVRKNFSDPIEEALQGRSNPPRKVINEAPEQTAPAAKEADEAASETSEPVKPQPQKKKSVVPKTPAKKSAASTETKETKKSVGRPRVEDALKKQYKISVMLSSDINDMLANYKPALGGSVSAYVESLIRADMEKNEATYKQISDMLKRTHK